MAKAKKPQAPFRNKNLFVVLSMILLLVFMMRFSEDGNAHEMTRTEFLAMMADSTIKIQEITLQKTADGIVVEGKRFLTPEESKQTNAKGSAWGRFMSAKSGETNTQSFTSHLLSLSNDEIATWEKSKNVNVTVIHETPGIFEHIIAFLPVILLIAF
ncbi:MAG: cell division protein FtsH, partial [Fibrobacteraceae bacterium]|nr:cell division protein FtsH [Fibrobacteraceae bacterium]